MTTTCKNVLVFREMPPDQLARLQAAHAVALADPRLPGQLPAFSPRCPNWARGRPMFRWIDCCARPTSLPPHCR